MNYVRYIETKNRRLSRVGCMKCNSFLYDMQDGVSLKEAERIGLPHRVAIILSDKSYTDVVLCKTCDVIPADLPKLENTMKFGWLYEFIQAGRTPEMILELAKRVKEIKMLYRRDSTCPTPTL